MQLTTQKKVVLGLQHTMAMFGATILVPLITGLNASVALLAAGLGTLLFHLVTKRMVPVFLGSSFAFIPPLLAARAEGYSWEAVGSGIVGAAVIYIAMFDTHHLHRQRGDSTSLPAGRDRSRSSSSSV